MDLISAAQLQMNVHRLIRGEVSACLEVFKLNINKWMVLRLVQKLKNLTNSQIAEALGLDQPFVTVILKELSDNKLVQTIPHEEDLRKKVIKTTRKGTDLLHKVEEKLSVNLRQALHQVSEQELNTYFSILQKMQTSLEQ